MDCPRKGNFSAVFKIGQGADFYHPNQTCSWCGSLSGEEFMRRVEEGTLQMSGTDKNYKIYIRATEGSPNLPVKFYFQHLDEDQMKRFVDLYNQKKLKFYDGGLYVSPFFMTNL
jgi:hypothetical protein